LTRALEISCAARKPKTSPEEKLAPQFDGRFQVVTMCNVDKRPRPDFVKAYMHNGYFKSLNEVVHFYNTRDRLPRCEPGSPGEKVSWLGSGVFR
jgi:cytochrome c peroxidase